MEQFIISWYYNQNNFIVYNWCKSLPVLFLYCRLLIFGSYDREANIHCTLELSSGVWEEKQRSSIKTVQQICIVLHLSKLLRSINIPLIMFLYLQSYFSSCTNNCEQLLFVLIQHNSEKMKSHKTVVFRSLACIRNLF